MRLKIVYYTESGSGLTTRWKLTVSNEGFYWRFILSVESKFDLKWVIWDLALRNNLYVEGCSFH